MLYGHGASCISNCHMRRLDDLTDKRKIRLDALTDKWETYAQTYFLFGNSWARAPLHSQSSKSLPHIHIFPAHTTTANHCSALLSIAQVWKTSRVSSGRQSASSSRPTTPPRGFRKPSRCSLGHRLFCHLGYPVFDIFKTPRANLICPSKAPPTRPQGAFKEPRSNTIPRQPNRHTDRQTDIQTDTQPDKQTDWQTDRPKDRQTDRQTASIQLQTGVHTILRIISFKKTYLISRPWTSAFSILNLDKHQTFSHFTLFHSNKLT